MTDKIIEPEGVAACFGIFDKNEDNVINGVLCYWDGNNWRQYSAEGMASAYVKLGLWGMDHKVRADHAEAILKQIERTINDSRQNN